MKKMESYSTIGEQLKKELERLRVLTDGIDEIIYVIDPDTYEILFANKKTKELFGKKIIGKKCYELFQNLNRPCPFCTKNHLFGENLEKTHIRGLQNKRNKRWYKCVNKAIKQSGGKYVQFGIAIDVTEQKEMEEALRESEQLFRSVVENSHDCILIIDDNFRIIYANDEVVRLSGYPKEEIIGQDFREFPDENSKSLVKDRYLRRQKGENVPLQYKFKIVRKNGEKRDVEIKSTVMQDSQGRARTVAQLLDITEHERMEEDRKRFEERLSALNTYGQSLNRAKNMEEVYKLTLDAMDKTLGFEFADIFIVDGKMLSLVVHRGYSKNLSVKLPLDGKKGVTAKAARVGKPVYVPDIRKEKAYVKGGEGILSELAVPIKIGNRVLGVLNVENKRLAAFDKEDKKLLEILASHAAAAIGNLKRQEKLSALNEYGRNLNRVENSKQIYALTLNAMEKTLGFEFATFFTVEGKRLRLVSHRGYPKKLRVLLPLEGDIGIGVKAARVGKPVFVPNIRKEKAYVEGRPGMLSELAVPIKVGSKVLGVLNVESERLAAFDKEDMQLLEILASHAATAMSNLERRKNLKIISKKIKDLMKNSTEIMQVKDMRKRLEVIAKAVQKIGWRRVVISLRDENLEGTDRVTVGLTKEESELLRKRRAPGHVWRERLGPKFERFKIDEFYYLPWIDPWIRENVHGVPPEVSLDEATTYTGVPSKLSQEEMVDWHPQDMLYAPLRTPDGRIVGILSMDDPIDGRKPTRESLTPLQLFLHQAAITIENAQLIESLREARKQLEEYAGQLEQKVEDRTLELRKSQEQLLRVQRLAVIGELAGMVGHDLRNPLTSISGAEYYLKKRLSPKVDSKIREMLTMIEKNIAYSNKIINDLLDYSREIELELTESNSKSIVKEALSLVEMPKNLRIVDLTENKPKINVDVGKIRRAFVNIIKNAVEAMPKGGTLTIKSRKLDDNLEIAVSDTGGGMSKETLEKLWTPLFTTKAKGMGFGLPICKRFIEAHGGSISAKSTPRKGTTFTVTLPIEPKIEKGGEKVWVKSLESSLLTMMKT
jgi:PAS domain S-box-containing protein